MFRFAVSASNPVFSVTWERLLEPDDVIEQVSAWGVSLWPASQPLEAQGLERYVDGSWHLGILWVHIWFDYDYNGGRV